MEVENPPEIQGYEILKNIGGGWTSQVYRARDSATDEKVAIKVLRKTLTTDREARGRIQREIRVLSEIDHANIARIIDHGDAGGAVWIAMEYFPGKTLKDRLYPGGPVGWKLPAEDVLRLTRDCLRGIHHLHKLRLVHRDIKPENIFKRRMGTYVLGDLGLAKRSDSQSMAVTGAGWFVGSLGYAPPELFRNQLLSYPSDVFSLGLVLHEALTGVHPTDHGPVGPDFVPPELELDEEYDPRLPYLVKSFLNPDPERRPTALEEIARSLENPPPPIMED